MRMVSTLKRHLKFSNLISKQSLISSFIVSGRKLADSNKQVCWNHKLFSKSLHGLVPRYSGLSYSQSHGSDSANIQTKTDAHTENLLNLEENFLLLRGSNGKKIKFHFIWLRDHCQCSECYHPITSQRQIDTFKIPLNIKPEDVSMQSGTLKIVYEPFTRYLYHTGIKGVKTHVDVRFHTGMMATSCKRPYRHGTDTISWPDGHISHFTTSWLHEHQYGQEYECFDIRSIEKVLWNSEAAQNFPEDSVFSEILEDDEKLLCYLEKIVKYGIAFVGGVPQPYKENLKRLGDRMGLIHNTFYGDVWSFTSGNVDFADTAFLQIKLDCHNDGTYFYESPGLQLLHCDSHDGKGGENIFVDGFYVAQLLQKMHPEAFHFLAKTNIPSFYYEKNEFLFKALGPVIKLDDFTNDIYQIRFNSSDRDILSCLSFEDVEKFYESSHKLTALIRDSSNELVVKPRPGRAAIFDNWRVFHAREGFTGTRSITGLYARRGDFLSKIHSLRSKLSI